MRSLFLDGGQMEKGLQVDIRTHSTTCGQRGGPYCMQLLCIFKEIMHMKYLAWFLARCKDPVQNVFF